MSISRNPQAGVPADPGHRLARIMHRLATPLTTGLFVVSAVSGTALFFRWMPGAFHAMHVWLSMVLLAPFLLHVWRNWRPLIGYARRGSLSVPLALSLAAAIPFAVSGSGKGHGGNPAFRAMALMTQARLVDLAPVLKTTPDALLKAIERRGGVARSPDDTLDRIASASGRNASELLLSVMPRR